MIPISLTAVALILEVAIAVILIRKYIRTHDTGLIWLAAATVIWPALTVLLNDGERLVVDRLVKHQPIGFYPFSLVERGDVSIGGLITIFAAAQRLVGVVLLFIAATYLYRVRDSRPAVSN